MDTSMEPSRDSSPMTPQELEEAAGPMWVQVRDLLRGEPFLWDANVGAKRIPPNPWQGSILVRFTNGDEDDRLYYAAVNGREYSVVFFPDLQAFNDWRPSDGGQIRLPSSCDDPFVVALCFAAAIARMEIGQ